MKKKITSTTKRGFSVSLLLLTLFLTLSFSGMAQTIIYQQNFDGNNGSYSNTLVSQSGTNGWIASSTAAQYSNYRHVWNFSNVTTGGNNNVLPISGRSLGMGFWNGNAPNVTNQFFRTWDGTTCNAIPATARWAHVGASTVGYENITVEFKWRCLGEVDSGTIYDYGTVNTSIDGGSTWLMDETGGQSGATGSNGSFAGGLYYGNAGVQTATLTLPSSRDNKANFRLAFRMVLDECYGTGGGFIIDDIIIRGTPISTNKTLTASGAYTGATYANGPHTIANNASVTATSGTRPGFTVSGWTGTGSVPATGSTGSATFTITQNSTITWNWVSATATGTPVFYNQGGSEQLVFNNSRLNDDTPTFRLSHATNPATNYRINIHENASFSGAGQSFQETFTGSYAKDTQANFTMATTAGQLVAGKTYYVRAQTSGDSGSIYSAWSSVLYSFTYESAATLAHWFQTTQAQLATASTSGVTANATNSLELTNAGGNLVTNGDFSSGTTGWTISKSYGNSQTAEVVNASDSNCAICTPASKNFKIGYPWAVNSILTSDYIILAQNVDLTNVNEIKFNIGKMRSFGGLGTPTNTSMYFKIGGTTANETGTTEYTTSLNSNGSSYEGTVTINTTGYTGVQTIKFIVKTFGNWDANTTAFYYINNVIASSPPSGTATSTSFELASVLGAAKYDKLEWNQALNGGTVSMKLQSSANGSSWSDVSGHTAITQTGDGLKTHDISGITATAYLRAVATLSGTPGVLINDWALYAKSPCEAMISSANPANSSICPNTNTTITAVATNPAHTIRWYAAASGGSVLSTDATFTTPNLTTTTTYYVAAFNGTCESDARTAVTITVNQISSSVTTTIGTPANGASHYINVNWTAISGATQYQVEYSWDNATWNVGGFSTSTTLAINLGDNPNRQVYTRVKVYLGADCYAYALPIYTAADLPNLVVLSNPTGNSMQISLQAETPAENPAITTYSLFNETLGSYVQADGTLGATEVFQTKATWGTTTVTGLTAETNYCFYAKARNEDGDVRFAPAQTLFPTQKFNSDILTHGTSAANNTWFAPAPTSPAKPAFTYNTPGCDGGRIGYSGNWNNWWGNMLRLPEQNLTGNNEVTLAFTVSHSYLVDKTASYFQSYIWADGKYQTSFIPTPSIKINGIPYTSVGTPIGKVDFDQARECVNVEITFDITTIIDKSSLLFYIVANSSYNSSDPFYFYMDDIAMTGGSSFSSPDAICLTTGTACPLLITETTGASGCGSVILNAVGNAGTDQYKWYDAATGGNLVATTLSGDYQTPVLTQTTTYYVAAFNDDCESPRVAVTATITPTTAYIDYSEGVSTCEPGNVTVYGYANGSNTVRWYDAATGGNLLSTDEEYTFNATQSLTLYVAAVEGDCESERIEVSVGFIGKVWNGSVSVYWDDAANWTPAGLPNSTNCVLIPYNTTSPIIGTGVHANAKSLTFEIDGSLLVQTGGSITVVENVTLPVDDITGVTKANMTLENDGYLVQTGLFQGNNNTGKITVKRNSTPMFRLEATGWSSPVENQKLYDFAIGTVFNRIYKYDEPSNVFINTGITVDTNFEIGKGYSVRAPNTFLAVGTTKTTFEGTFYGRPSNNDINAPVTNDAIGNNYVGNPYPSPISATDFININSNVDALYFWTHESPPIGGVYAANNYASYNSSGGAQAAEFGVVPDGIINVGQGFVAKVNAAGTVKFNNSMRRTTSNQQFFKQTNATADRHRMWLNLSDSTTNFNQILIGYIPNATMAKDHKFDAKMHDYSGSAIYSLIDNDSFVIQGRSLPFDVTDEVALGFKAKQAGSFTVAIDHVDGLFLAGQTIYIVDQLTNSIHNLNEGAYTFVSEQGIFDTRFKVVYQTDAFLGVSNPVMTNNDWIVYKNDGKINIQTTGFAIENVEIFDLTGRLLLNQQNVNSNTFSFSANYAEQVLLVRVNKTLVKKVL